MKMNRGVCLCVCVCVCVFANGDKWGLASEYTPTKWGPKTKWGLTRKSPFVKL